MQKKCFGLLLFFIIVSFSAQNILWQRDFPSSTQDFLSGLSTTFDRQFLLSGSSIQPAQLSGLSSSGADLQNNGYDYHLVKLNQQGEKVWEKYFSGNNHDFLTATAPTQEGGFLLAGTTYSSKGKDKKQDLVGGSDIWLIKINENGEEEWQQSIGTSWDDEAKAVVQNTDLGYFVSASIEDPKQGFGSKDVWIIKLDAQGNPTQELVMGGKGMDVVERMIPTLDGGVLIGVYSRSGNVNLGFNSGKNGTSKPIGESHFKREKEQNKDGTASKNHKEPQIQFIEKDSENEGQGDFWVIKLDRDGKLQWQKNFGGTEDDHISTLALTATGYIVGGESRSNASGNKTSDIKEGTDVWIIALNPNGEKQWEQSYSFGNRDLLMSLSHITGTKSNITKGFLLGGYTQTEGRIEKDDETFWMLYVDANGKEEWRKYVEGESRQKEERLVSAKLLGDGSFILAGTSGKELGNENWKVVRLGDQQLDELMVRQDIRVYPNPVDEYCYVEIGFDFKEATIELYDMGGRKIQTVTTKNPITKINTSSLVQGAYLIVAKTESKSANAKIIKK